VLGVFAEQRGSGRKYKLCHLGRETLPIDDRAPWLYEKALLHLHDAAGDASPEPPLPTAEAGGWGRSQRRGSRSSPTPRCSRAGVFTQFLELLDDGAGAEDLLTLLGSAREPVFEEDDPPDDVHDHA
jgi:hypothetical protein